MRAIPMPVCRRCRGKYAEGAEQCPSCGARLGQDSESRATGIAMGAFSLREQLFECAAGFTHRAIDSRRPDSVAWVKVLRHDLCQDEIRLARYFSEVRSVQRLFHPNIIRALDFGEHAA